MTKKIRALTPNQLKAARHGLGLSQDQLAVEAGVHPNSVWRWENVNGSGLEHAKSGSMDKIGGTLGRLGIVFPNDGSINIPANPQPRPGRRAATV